MLRNARIEPRMRPLALRQSVGCGTMPDQRITSAIVEPFRTPRVGNVERLVGG